MSVEQIQYIILMIIASIVAFFLLAKLFAFWNENQAKIRAKIIAFLSPKENAQLSYSLSEAHPELVHVEAKFKELGVVSARS